MNRIIYDQLHGIAIGYLEQAGVTREECDRIPNLIDRIVLSGTHVLFDRGSMNVDFTLTLEQADALSVVAEAIIEHRERKPHRH